MFLIIFMQLASTIQEWRLIHSDFYQEQITSSGKWEFKETCGNDQYRSFSNRQCETNPLNFLRLLDDKAKLENEFYYPHRQIRIITDIIYIRAQSSTNSVFKVQLISNGVSTEIHSRQYQESSIQTYNKICTQSCGWFGCNWLDDSRVELKTLILDNVVHASPIFSISYCFSYANSAMRIGLRNILIYVQTCHISCLTCNGDTENNCLTCYQGTAIAGVCKCDEQNSYIHNLIGCTQECNRDYYLSDNSKYCQFDPRIKSKLSYFTSTLLSNGNLLPYDPWNFIPDPFYDKNTNLKVNCNGEDMIGYFNNYEMIQLKLEEQKNLKFIRIRVSFYLFGFQTGSEMRITVDSYSNGQIIKTLTNYTRNSIDLIKFQTSSCSGNNYDFLRIETVLKVQTKQPVIKFFALTKQPTEFWAFKNVTIDYGICTNNCTECETFSRCKICDNGYQLYRGKCVDNCPVHTNLLANGTCQDYEDEIKNSRYLIKAFHDMNTTFEEVNKVVDNFTFLNDALQTSFTGAIYSFVPEKSVLGGVLVWKSGKFKKTFYSLNPHYQISYRFNVTYGDENPGWFKYQFDNDISNQIYNPNNGNVNSIGDSKKETTKYFSGLQQSHSNPKLDIIFSADTTKASIEDAFMYVSDYFVVVHYCAPFCSSCNGPEISDCATGNYLGYNSTKYCASNQYLNFDTNTNIYSCINCPQFGCIECQSSSICTRCEYSNLNKLVLDQGTCQCYPSQYLYNNNCLQCNRYCETCFGQNDNQCFTCISEFHRSINQFQCKCIPGYFDVNINLQCFPICGDTLVVDGEDCDDGNNDPYDGCDQCQFSCQESCLDCKKGFCYDCKDYYQLTPIKSCYSICGDNVTIGNEECDDGNIYPNDGCNQCKFQCYNHCIDCFQGKCRKCDEDNGYYLTGVNCEPICGDGIIAQELEDCDDANLNAFDFCDSCQINCSEFCEICQSGHCTKCRNGFIYNKKLKLCQPQCGDYNVVGNEECDDNNFAILDGCYNCKFLCQNECSQCKFGKCYDCLSGWQINLQTYICEIILDDGILTNFTEICDDQNHDPMDGCFQQQYECQDSCQFCYLGMCIRCETGWQLNKQNNQCFPICGDDKIVGNEFCDDGNRLIYDKCFQCNFICDSNCQFCSYGICQECNIGYQLINNKCIELCGDDIKVKEEECETSLVQFDQQCLQCKYYCDNGCEFCVQGICQTCHKGFQLINYNCHSICGDKLIVGQEECDDGNQVPFDGCNNCKFECQEECLNCQFNKCLDCQNGFDKKDYYCLEECGNLIITKNEQCDDGNLEPFDGCFECNYSCDAQCDICEYGKCYKCRSQGWIINDVDKTCIPFCGDSIIVGYEQCDDGNNDRYDGCYECYFECQNECTLCLEDKCHQCDTIGWTLFDYKCIPICGDNLVVGTEQCDDGNDIPYDGCFECQDQCQEQCTLCQNGICNECHTLGWILIDHKCQPDCGDKIVIQPYEQCDDGNNEQYDGCYECQYQCQQQCEECQLGKCESCKLGWIINNGICVPFCGDNLIVGNEQCDYGVLQVSTCINCQQVCDSYCLECENGICYNCIQGMYLNDKNQCFSQCGDGYTVNEDCDDGNNQLGDGCNSECRIEKGWICVTQNLYSQCFYSEYPKMMLSLLTNNPDTVQFVQIHFNQPMKLYKDNFYPAKNYFKGNITNLVNDQYNLSFNFIIEPSFQETKDILILVAVNFFQNIEDPLLLVELEKNAFISDFSSEILDFKQQIKLKTPVVLSSSQISASENAQTFNYIVIYFLIGLSFICFLTGSFDVFWNLMDLLQYLSYIKYVNINFPLNLNIYFEVFKLISLQPILNFLCISSILSLTDGEKDYFVKTKGKFFYDDINGYFFANFQSTMICFLGLFGFYFFAKISLKILYQFGPYHMSYLGYYPSKLIYSLRQILNDVQCSFYFSSLLRMLLSNYYDICFSVFIQLINFNTQDKILTINSYAAIIILIFQILFFIYLFNFQLSFSKQSTLKKLQSYKSLIEGVKYNKCLWTGQYNTIQLFKKQLFIFLIVFMQNNGTLQAICVALNQTIVFVYLLSFKPLTQIQEYRKLLVSESVLAINTLLFLAYAYKIELALSIQNFINIGWFHIVSFSFILTFSLIYDMKSQFYELYLKVRNQFSKKQQPKNTNHVVFY